jgi:SAM-dependent methyltransferase
LQAEVLKAFSGVASYYDQYMEETGHVQAQRRIARSIAEVATGLVLDVATGTGIMLEPFRYGIGVDISKEMIEEAKAKYPGRKFLVADAHRLPLEDMTFDVALSCLAFPWLENPDQVLGEMLRVARKAYIIEEEGVPARKRLEVPKRLRGFFETIGKLEKEVDIGKLAAGRGFSQRRVLEADIDGAHKFVCWEVTY